MIQDSHRLYHVLQGCPEILGKYWNIHGSSIDQSFPYTLVRVSTDSLVLQTSLDHPYMPGFLPPLVVRVSMDSLVTPDILGSSMDAWLPTTTPPPLVCQSIHGFPGNSGHHWIIHGCLAPVRVHTQKKP